MSNTTSATTKKQTYLEAWLAANPKAKKAAGGTSTVLPVEASREEQDLASIYASAAENATAIEQRAQQSIFNANKANDLASKYLAAQNQANGLGGLGIADTSSLRLSSIYQKALADANATKEQSLMENYLNASEKADTVRGEWASREEAEAEEKYKNAENAILMSEDEDKVKQYLNAAGYAEGTDDYNSLLNRWMLSYRDSKQSETEALKAYGVNNNLDSDGKVVVEDSYYDLNAPHAGFYSDRDLSLAEQIGAHEGWKNSDNQVDSLANVLKQSRTWSSEKNGTYVDFNDGKGTSIFVFYNGIWYKTNKTKKSIQAEGGTLYGVDDF